MPTTEHLDVDTVLGTQRVLDPCWPAVRTDRWKFVPSPEMPSPGTLLGIVELLISFLLGARSLEDFLNALARGHTS